jgi:hypothetical protein
MSELANKKIVKFFENYLLLNPDLKTAQRVTGLTYAKKLFIQLTIFHSTRHCGNKTATFLAVVGTLNWTAT